MTGEKGTSMKKVVYTGTHRVGEIVYHRRHKCIVKAVWVDADNGKNGITIEPLEGYGFEVDIYDEQL